MKGLLVIWLWIVTINLGLSQILWNSEADTLQLSQKILSVQGTIMIRNVRLMGSILIDYAQNEFYFRDSKAVYRLEKDDIQGITLEGYGTFSAAQMFTDATYESNLRIYRSRLFPSLRLNKIAFSLAKRSSYVIKDNTLSIDKEKIFNAKVISISPYMIRVIDAEGSIHKLKDNDFNYLELFGKRYFNCNSIYGVFYGNYYEVQLNTITEWKKKISKLTIDQLMSEMGPFDESIEFIDKRRLLTWEDDVEITVSNSNSTGISRSSSYTYRRSNSVNDSRSYYSTFESIPSLFLFNQSNVNTKVSSSTNSLSSTSSVTSTSGYKRTFKVKFTVLIDDQGKILDTYHLNIFKYPEYGDEFIFCNF